MDICCEDILPWTDWPACVMSSKAPASHVHVHLEYSRHNWVVVERTGNPHIALSSLRMSLFCIKQQAGWVLVQLDRSFLLWNKQKSDCHSCEYQAAVLHA
jgi:hypothetical protein